VDAFDSAAISTASSSYSYNKTKAVMNGSRTRLEEALQMNSNFLLDVSQREIQIQLQLRN